MKVTVYGEEIGHEELPEAPAADIRDHFASVQLSPLSIDSASRIVPEKFWKPYGLHTWLSKCADYAFNKLPTIKDREITIGRLKYVFEFAAEGPVLKNVVLV
jgi:hypothetical protein